MSKGGRMLTITLEMIKFAYSQSIPVSRGELTRMKGVERVTSQSVMN